MESRICRAAMVVTSAGMPAIRRDPMRTTMS
jgi:hypothetical protein